MIKNRGKKEKQKTFSANKKKDWRLWEIKGFAYFSLRCAKSNSLPKITYTREYQ